MHINNDECRYPELDNLFKVEDVTDEVVGLLAEIPGHPNCAARSFWRLDHEPDIAVGKHCDKPYSCPLKLTAGSQYPARPSSRFPI